MPWARAPVRRQRVRLNHRGVADRRRRGLFQRTALATGHRFSFELALWSDHARDSRWDRLLALIHSPRFCLGGSIRQGLGQVKVIRCQVLSLDLGTRKGRETLGRVSPCLDDTAAFVPWSAQGLALPRPWAIRLHLVPEPGGLRLGGGYEPLSGQDNTTAQGAATMSLPMSERRILWDQDRGAVEENPALVAASHGP